MSEGNRRETLTFIADLFGAIATPITVIVAIVAFASSSEAQEVGAGTLASTISVFVVGVILATIGALRRLAPGHAFRSDRGRGASMLLYVGLLLMAGAVVGIVVFR